MTNFTDLTGLASAASVTTASLLMVPRIARLGKAHLAMLLASVLVLTLIPFGGMPLAAYVRGMTGDLSITTMVLLWCALLRPWDACAKVRSKHRYALLILIACSAIAFYPMALGAGLFDPYRLGYGNPQFVAALLFLALFAWYRESVLIALCIALALLAWSVGWYESDNIWDYLLDPFVAFYALAASLIYGANKLQKWQRDSTG